MHSAVYILRRLLPFYNELVNTYILEEVTVSTGM